MIGSLGRLTRLGALAATAAALSPALFAQQQLDRDITFVRALAKEMRFIELARLEADDLAKNNRGAAEQDKIAQLAVEIAYYGARSRSDRAQQRALFKETVDKSKELIERSSDATLQLEARATLANASQDFGQFLVEELEIAREQAPDRVKELEEEATGVFRAGIDACSKVMDALKDSKDEQKKIEYYLMWMKKAVLSREQGRADKTNRSILVNRSIEELSEMVLDVGEETAIGLRGLFEIAQCKEVDGKVPEAIDSYRGTIKQIATSLTQAQKGELDLTGEMQGFLFEMMQEVYVHTGEVMVRVGAQGTAELFAEFRKNMETFGEKGEELFNVVSDDHGHLMLLAESRFQAESGDPKKVGDALAMAQRINDKHPQDYVGVRAKAVLRDILALQRNLVSGTLLFEVAKGELQNKNYEEAIKGLRRAIPALNADEQQKLGLESWQMLGTAYGFSDRYVEAILAFSQGLRKFGKKDDDRSSDTADGLDRAISANKRTTKNDAFFDPLYNDCAQLIANFGGAAGVKLFMKQGTALFNDKKFAEAIAQYKQVTPDFPFYEQAQVLIARAQSMSGDFAGARKTLATWRDYAGKTTLPASETQKQQVRQTAVADAEFIEVQMAYLEARGSDELKVKKDLTRYPTAIDKATGFVTNFQKDGEGSIPTALEYLARLNCDLAKLAEAEQAYTQIKPKDPVRASRVATEIFKEYQNQVKLLEEELNQAIAKNKGEAAETKARGDLTAMRNKLVALGMDYIAGSPKPQLGILVATMSNHEELRDWKRVDEVAQKTLDLYGSDATEAVKKVVDLTVRPKIGEAMLQQQRFTEAYPMLVEAEKANPAQWELKRQIARALGGWFEFSKTGQGQKVAGLDKPTEAFHKYYGDRDNAYRVWALRPEVKPFSLEWYTFHWEAYWFAKQAGAKDGKMKEVADTLYRKARATDDFATLKSHGEKGLLLFKYFQSNR
ncbi:MAG: hypothetical protein WAT39_18595 [Planctomycetota bacterium]